MPFVLMWSERLGDIAVAVAHLFFLYCELQEANRVGYSVAELAKFAFDWPQTSPGLLQVACHSN